MMVLGGIEIFYKIDLNDKSYFLEVFIGIEENSLGNYTFV